MQPREVPSPAESQAEQGLQSRPSQALSAVPHIQGGGEFPPTLPPVHHFIPIQTVLKDTTEELPSGQGVNSKQQTQVFPQAFPSAAPTGLRRMWGLRDQLQKNPRQVFTSPASSHTAQGLCRGLGAFSHLNLLLHNLQAQAGAAKRHLGFPSTAGRVPKAAINQENHSAFCFVTRFADSK